MIVRMFKPQFAELVEHGAKRQTVRPTPKRMPKAGDAISLRMWTGKPYRSPQRTLRDAIVERCAKVEIGLGGVAVDNEMVDCEEFAHADGFPNFFELRKWFILNHGLPHRDRSFVGIVIFWK